MSSSPEKEPVSPRIPEGVSPIPQTPEIPRDLEQQTGVQSTQQSFTAQVQDDQGNPLITSTDDSADYSVQNPPGNQEQLTSWAKGKAVDSLTWFASFWIRMLKKAAYAGKKVVGMGQNQ